jgi:NADPH:quinone reductase-like Zn-dependent oxidoreductase
MLGLKLTEVEIPKPGDNDVIIKVHAAPINPSDIAFIQGSYNVIKTLPTIPGFEASGNVIDAGINAKDLIGRNVSCFVQTDRCGTWSEFVVAHKSDVIALKDDMDMDQAAGFTVNPFTAYGMFKIALRRDSKAVIQNAAGGQVAAFIRMMAAENNIQVVNIVRKKESAERLIKGGSKYVLVESDENFKDQLNNLVRKLNATVAFDAVGGSLSGMMFNVLPANSELVVYGGLSNKPITDISIMEMIFNNKVISGFNLMDWKSSIEDEEFIRISEEIQDKFISGAYNTNIRDISSLSDIVSSIRTYISDMSSGKLLLKP